MFSRFLRAHMFLLTVILSAVLTGGITVCWDMADPGPERIHLTFPEE